VYVIKFLCGLIIGLERVVLQWPCRRYPVGMSDLIEVLLSKPQQNGTINLAVAAYEIVKAGMKALSIRAVPSLRRLIARVHEHCLAVPILAFAGEVTAALQKKDPFASLG
jgi:hypothetical protein